MLLCLQNHCWFFVVGGEFKTRLTIILYFLLVIFQNGQREQTFFYCPCFNIVLQPMQSF